MSQNIASEQARIDDQADTRATPPPSAWQRVSGNSAFWVLVLDIVLIFIFGILSQQQVFWSVTNAQNLAVGLTESLLLALGLAVLLGAGQLDLSVGANLVLSSVIGALVIRQITGAASPTFAGQFHDVAVAAVIGLLLCLLTGVIIGVVNGVLVAYFQINSLIATLGTTGVATGLALLLTQGGDIGNIAPGLQQGFGLATILGVPTPALVAIVIALVLWAMIRFTRYGVHTLAIGSSNVAAERAGIRVSLHVLSLFILTGVLAGLAGFVDISRFASTTVSGHTTDALGAITAVVIGGTALEGGRVNIPGAVCGAVLAVVLVGGLVTIGVPPFYQLIAVGCILIVAVTIDRFQYTRRQRA